MTDFDPNKDYSWVVPIGFTMSNILLKCLDSVIY